MPVNCVCVSGRLGVYVYVSVGDACLPIRVHILNLHTRICACVYLCACMCYVKKKLCL